MSQSKPACEEWRRVFRAYVLTSELLPSPHLKALRSALVHNDPRLTRDGTTVPPMLASNKEELVRCACPLAWALWMGEELDTVVQVDNAFDALLLDIALRSGSKLTVTPLIDYIDLQPWDTVRSQLAAEIDLWLHSEKDSLHEQSASNHRLL